MPNNEMFISNKCDGSIVMQNTRKNYIKLENISKVVRSTWSMLARWIFLGDKPYANAFKVFPKNALGFIICLFLGWKSRPIGPQPP